MSTVTNIRGQRLVLHGEPWETYVRLLRVFDQRRHVRITYDRGELEIMTLSHEHESYSYLLGRLIDALTEELGLPIKGGKSTTFKRRKKHRGLEPDNCYWIVNEGKVRGKRKIDLRMDPPPDLAVEIDISHSSLDRMGVYASLGVPEVWRFDGQALAFLRLGSDGRYLYASESLSFSGLIPTEVESFLGLVGKLDENSLVKQFRAWVQSRISAGWK